MFVTLKLHFSRQMTKRASVRHTVQGSFKQFGSTVSFPKLSLSSKTSPNECAAQTAIVNQVPIKLAVGRYGYNYQQRRLQTAPKLLPGSKTNCWTRVGPIQNLECWTEYTTQERYIYYMLAIFRYTFIKCWIKIMGKNLRRSQANKVWTFRVSCAPFQPKLTSATNC